MHDPQEANQYKEVLLAVALWQYDQYLKEYEEGQGH
jgi:hypothetical protein